MPQRVRRVDEEAIETLTDRAGTSWAVSVTVRPYRATDRAAVRELALACADERVLPACLVHRPEWIADLLTAYYTDHEPESSVVAENSEGDVIGYLFGCRSTARRDGIVGARILPRVVARSILTGAIFHCPVRKLASAGWRSRRSARTVFRRAAEFPAHLHVGLRPDARNRGLGRRMLAAALEILRAEGVAGVHASVVATNRPAQALFLGAGFRWLGRYPVYFAGSPTPVDMEMLGRQITAARPESGPSKTRGDPS